MNNQWFFSDEKKRRIGIIGITYNNDNTMYMCIDRLYDLLTAGLKITSGGTQTLTHKSETIDAQCD